MITNINAFINPKHSSVALFVVFVLIIATTIALILCFERTKKYHDDQHIYETISLYAKNSHPYNLTTNDAYIPSTIASTIWHNKANHGFINSDVAVGNNRLHENDQDRNENENISESAINETSGSQCQEAAAVCEEQICTASHEVTDGDECRNNEDQSSIDHEGMNVHYQDEDDCGEQQPASGPYERVQDYEQQPASGPYERVQDYEQQPAIGPYERVQDYEQQQASGPYERVQNVYEQRRASGVYDQVQGYEQLQICNPQDQDQDYEQQQAHGPNDQFQDYEQQQASSPYESIQDYEQLQASGLYDQVQDYEQHRPYDRVQSYEQLQIGAPQDKVQNYEKQQMNKPASGPCDQAQECEK